MKEEITLHAGKKTYTLCYTLRTIQRARRLGFRIENYNEMPVSTLSVLVHSAFWAHHPRITENQVFSNIYPHIPHKKEFINSLMEMYKQKEELCRKAGRL